MSFALPLVGALAGGAIALGAGAAITSTTMMLAVNAGFLVGSWLMYSTMDLSNDVLDTGMQEAPRFNSAVRGSTIPILFGTNRVPAQIVWQANFETIRNESGGGGGGKGGGSGGSKVQQPTQTSYTYKIDAVYHLGIVPAPVNLYAGWLAGQLINDSSITSIAVADSVGDGFVYGWQSPEEAVGIKYDEAIFFTGDINEADTWAWLTSSVGGSVVWPGTTWVGFKGLDLGQSGTLPQLNFEVGPLGGSMAGDSGHVSGLDITGQWVSNNTNIDRYGNWWLSDTYTPPGELRVYSPTGGLLRAYSSGEIEGLIGAEIDFAYNLEYFVCSAIIGSGDNQRLYTIARLLKTTSPTSYRDYYVSWTFDELGNITLEGYCYTIGIPLEIATGPVYIEQTKNRANDSPIFFGYRLSSGYYKFQICPSLNYIQSRSGEQVRRYVYVFSNDADLRYLGYEDLTNYNSAPYCYGNIDRLSSLFIVPYYDIDILGLSIMTRVYWVRNRSMAYASTQAGTKCQWDVLNCTGNFANGGMAYYDFQVSDVDLDLIVNPTPTTVSTNLADTSIVMQSNPFYDENGTAYHYFDDEWVDFDGNSANYDFLYTGTPYVQVLDSGWTVVIFIAPGSSPPGYIEDTNYTIESKYRAYLYNPYTQTFTELLKFKAYLSKIQEAHPNLPGYAIQAGIDWGGGIALRRVGDDVWMYYHGGPSVYGDLQQQIAVSKLGTLDVEIGADVTPPYIIRQILVNDVFGLQPGADIIDETSYSEAVTYCEDNGLKVSAQYRREEPALRAIELLLSVYGGWLSVMPAVGKIKFGVMDLSNTPVRTIDNSRLIVEYSEDSDEPIEPPVKTTTGALQDTFNVIRINYIDRELGYQQNQVEERDEVDEDLNGTRVKEFPPFFVMSRRTAEWMATKALWSNLYTRDSHQFYLGAKDADLEPGDLITLVDSYGSINQVAQIVRMAEVERMKYEVVAVQQLPYVTGLLPSQVSSVSYDMLATGGTSISSLGYLTGSGTVTMSGVTTNPSCGYTGGLKPGPIPPAVFATAYELPAEYQLSNPVVYIGWGANYQVGGARLWISPDGITYAPTLTAAPYPVWGKMLTAIDSGSNVFDEDVIIDILPAADWSVTSPTYSANITLDEVTEAGMHLGAGLLWVGSEMLAYHNVTLVGQNRYRLGRVYRGWGGTFRHSHTSGSIFHKHGTGIFARAYNEDQIGTQVYFKVTPFNTAGYMYDVSSATAQVYTIQGDYYSPQVPSAIQLDGNGKFTRLNVGSDCDITVAWKDSARKSGYGAGGYGTNPGGYGGFTTDTLSHAWRVTVVGSGNVVVRSTSVGSPSYTYTNSQNASDNGAWRGNVAINVTPYSPWGDAPRTSIISLDLFY